MKERMNERRRERKVVDLSEEDFEPIKWEMRGERGTRERNRKRNKNRKRECVCVFV